MNEEDKKQLEYAFKKAKEDINKAQRTATYAGILGCLATVGVVFLCVYLFA